MLNKSKGNMYSFITHTWNPLAGKCPHKCAYCSTNKFYYPILIEKYSGEIRVQESELTTNLGKDNYIFVVAQNDLFANEVPVRCIKKILEYCEKFNSKYLFQTKNPKRFYQIMIDMPFSKEYVLCTTIETNRYIPEIMGESPTPQERAYMMNECAHELNCKTFVTIEPIMDFDLKEMLYLIETCLPEQVNIGADSGKNGLPEPSKEKLIELINELKKFTTIHKKNNLKRILDVQ